MANLSKDFRTTGLRHDVLADDFLHVLAQRIATVGRQGAGNGAVEVLIYADLHWFTVIYRVSHKLEMKQIAGRLDILFLPNDWCESVKEDPRSCFLSDLLWLMTVAFNFECFSLQLQYCIPLHVFNQAVKLEIDGKIATLNQVAEICDNLESRTEQETSSCSG